MMLTQFSLSSLRDDVTTGFLFPPCVMM